MPVSRKDGSPKKAGNGKKQAVMGLKESNNLPSKRTLNLCMRETSNISIEAFLISLAVILAVVILLEFLAIYRPYARVEALERQVAAAQAAVDAKYGEMNGYDKQVGDKHKKPDGSGYTVEEFYRQFNYEGFDLSVADRLDIFTLLETHILNAELESGRQAQITSLSIDGNVITLRLAGPEKNDLDKIYESLIGDPMVLNEPYHPGVFVSSTSYDSDGVPVSSMVITLKDATTVVKPRPDAPADGGSTDDTTGGGNTDGTGSDASDASGSTDGSASN